MKKLFAIIITFIPLIATSFMSLISIAQSTTNPKHNIALYKTNQPIKIDGILNEHVWKKALLITDLDNSKQPGSSTKVYLTYDKSSLFVGISCQTNDTASLPVERFAKDDQRMLGHDWAAFCVDAYNDQLNAFAFISDAAGNQLNGSLSPSEDLSYSFSTTWTSAVIRNKKGYTIEMKIPLKKLPLKWYKDSVVIAVQFIRSDKGIKKAFVNNQLKNKLGEFQGVVLKGVNPTQPDNLSGVNMRAKLNYKKQRSKLFDRNTQSGRGNAWGDASVIDYAIFKKRIIKGSKKLSVFPVALKTAAINHDFEKLDYLEGCPINNFDQFLERTQTSAFLILKNDTVIYEKYFNGFSSNSVFTSFSIAKSFVSALIGIAIKQGYIKSDTDNITKYIPELLKKNKKFSHITIKDLITMSSGMHFSEDAHQDDEITYTNPDLRNAALKNVKIDEVPGKHWLYDNYHLLLLGMILERTTHMSVSRYLQENLWKKMGGDNASWSLDEHGFEKMESGINCSAYDYARLGELYLHHGKFNHQQIVPGRWITEATQPLPKPKDWSPYLQSVNEYYGYFWWGRLRTPNISGNDFFALGNKGEYIYVCPDKQLVVIRLGFEFGLQSPGSVSWPDLFYQYATNAK